MADYYLLNSSRNLKGPQDRESYNEMEYCEAIFTQHPMKKHITVLAGFEMHYEAGVNFTPPLQITQLGVKVTESSYDNPQCPHIDDPWHFGYLVKIGMCSRTGDDHWNIQLGMVDVANIALRR